MGDEWIAVEWRRKADIAALRCVGDVKIRLLNSPFYEGERYEVRVHGRCLSKACVWEWEPLPSCRDDAFYQRCRFDTFNDAVEALSKAPIFWPPLGLDPPMGFTYRMFRDRSKLNDKRHSIFSEITEAPTLPDEGTNRGTNDGAADRANDA